MIINKSYTCKYNIHRSILINSSISTVTYTNIYISLTKIQRFVGHAKKILESVGKSSLPKSNPVNQGLIAKTPEAVANPSNNTNVKPIGVAQEASSVTPTTSNVPVLPYKNTSLSSSVKNPTISNNNYDHIPAGYQGFGLNLWRSKLSESHKQEDSATTVSGSNIPTPSPIPTSTHKPITNTVSVPFKTELHALNPNMSDNNIKPSAVITNKSGKSVPTQITQNTKLSDLNTAELIKEMISRELVTKDIEQTLTTIKDVDGNDVIVGKSKNNMKMTSLGQAYHSMYINKNKTNPGSINFSISDEENMKFMIVFPPKSEEDLFLETGKQKHLLVVYFKKTNEYYSIGFLTSTKKGDLLSEKQYKAFEKEQENALNKNIDIPENNIGHKKEKAQHYVKTDIPEQINSEDIRVTKYSQEYLDSINKYELLRKQVEKPIGPYNVFNKKGLTKEDCLNMCKTHDENVKNKQKHPETQDQIAHAMQAKNKQQENQLKKKNKINNDDTVSQENTK